jgi:hypothetical protein
LNNNNTHSLIIAFQNAIEKSANDLHRCALIFLSDTMEITRADILEAVRATGTTQSYCSNQTYLTKKFGRKPNRLERLILTTTLKELDNLSKKPTDTSLSYLLSSETQSCLGYSCLGYSNESGQLKSDEILVCTAYSEDYTVGNLCELVNREYANKHGLVTVGCL